MLGVPLALTDYERTLDWIDAAVAAGARGYVCVAAVHTVMACQEDPELRAAVLGRRLHGAGRPAAGLGAERARPRAPRPRVRPGADGPRLRPRRADRPALLPLRRPQPRRAGRARAHAAAAPPRPEDRRRPLPAVPPLTAAEEDAVADDINRSGADVVWVGIGVPKQEKWMARMRDRLDAPVLVGVGAAFDFHAGLVPQAPPRCSGSASSGRSGSCRSRAGCGGATCATTRASCSASRASTRRHLRAR